MKIYAGQINKSYYEPLYNPMIHKYQTQFQIKNETDTWHDALRWTKNEVFIKQIEENAMWNINFFKICLKPTNIVKKKQNRTK